MALSKSQKNRKKQAKEKGYDLNELKRGGQNVVINLSTRKTKTKQEKLNKLYQKEKQSDYRSAF